VQRQYTGTAGRIENAQVAVYLGCAAPRGHALIDRELYLPKSWTGDPARCEAAGIPGHAAFATRPQLARLMIERAVSARVPFAWVAADEAYGDNGPLRTWLEQQHIAYVLAVARDHRVPAGVGRTVRADALAARLPRRAVAQGGDLGAFVTDEMARQAPEGLLGIHLNLLKAALVGPAPAEPTEQERAALAAIAVMQTSGYGYFLEQATRPQTIGYALLDAPVALAAWMLDHDTDAYYKISRVFLEKQPSGHLTRDSILDNITLYWLTGTGASAAREYWENGQAAARAAGQAPPPVSVPVGFTVFPGEVFRAPRNWVQKAYPTLTYFHEVDRGGHFAAWEEPELFATEIRAAFSSLR
jgi:pimeloyl-ACP methyl ester carboxylesterase